MTTRLGALAALLLAAPPALGAQESVTLQFGWPPGSAAVSMTHETAVIVAGQSNSVTSEMDYRMSIAEADEGFIVSYSDISVDGVLWDEMASGGRGAELMSQAMANYQPDIRVARDGSFQGLLDYPGVRASMEEMIATLRSEMPGDAGGMFEDMMSGMMSEETISRTSRMGWDQLVGFWAGRRLTVGEPVTEASEMPLPMVANQVVAMDTELQFLGSVACDEGGAGEGCLELQVAATPDAEEMRNVMDIFMADMMEQMGGTGIEMGITEMTMSMVTRLVVDPETLRPFRMVTTVDMTMTMDMMGMSQGMQNQQVATTRFAWES